MRYEGTIYREISFSFGEELSVDRRAGLHTSGEETVKFSLTLEWKKAKYCVFVVVVNNLIYRVFALMLDRLLRRKN